MLRVGSPPQRKRSQRRFRRRSCNRGFHEHTGTLFNHFQYPTDVVCLVVLWRFRYKRSLRDLAEMFLQRGLVFTHEAVRGWEMKLAPLLTEALRQKRRGAVGNVGTSTRPILRGRDSGAISIVRLIGTGSWSTCRSVTPVTS
jgi:hypothetical protein